MHKRATFLPVAMVLIIGVLALIAIVSGRSNDTGLVGDSNYPFHICTFNDYCVGPACTRNGSSFIVYLEHANGRPLLEMQRVNTAASMTTVPDGIAFETTGGVIEGTLTIYEDRVMDFVGTSEAGDDVLEHFGTGRCERLKTP